MMEENGKITITPPNSITSGHELVIIPSEPRFVPNNPQIIECLDFLQSEYPLMMLTSEKFQQVVFVDCGQNFESVLCNKCKKQIDLEFWQEQMSYSYENSNFNELDFLINCCDEIANLNDLFYQDNCGFASYSLSINNAEPNDEQEERVQREIEKIMGTEINIFWRHI